MKATILMMLAASLLSAPALASSHKDKASRGQVVSDCNHRANDRDIKGQDRKAWVDRCIAQGGPDAAWVRRDDADRERAALRAKREACREESLQVPRGDGRRQAVMEACMKRADAPPKPAKGGSDKPDRPDRPDKPGKDEKRHDAR